MPTGGKPTLTQFLIEERRRHPGATGDLNALVTESRWPARPSRARSRSVPWRRARRRARRAARSGNVQGEAQKKLDVIAQRRPARAPTNGAATWRHGVGGDGRSVPDAPSYPRGKYLLLFDPLDGSSNIDVNVSVGTIFSMLAARRRDAADTSRLPAARHRQVAAGYASTGRRRCWC